MTHITLTISDQRPRDHQAISVEQIQQRRLQRRRRVAKRLAKRFPLFAVEMMQGEFPDYTYEEFVADVTRPTRKGKSFRRTKTPMTRCTRWPLYQKALNDYQLTGETHLLAKAQELRNRMYLRVELAFRLRGQVRIYSFHHETPWNYIRGIQQITGYNTWEELDIAIKDRLNYAQVHYSWYYPELLR